MYSPPLQMSKRKTSDGFMNQALRQRSHHTTNLNGQAPWNVAEIAILPPHQAEREPSVCGPSCGDMRSDFTGDDTMLADQDGNGGDGGPLTPVSTPATSTGLVSVGPIAVRNGPTHAPIDTVDKVGMSIAITLTSSSGVDADMAAVQDSEQVSVSYGHTGSLLGSPPRTSSTSSFMAGFPIPDDQHTAPRSFIIDRADNGGDGQYDKDQLDIFTAAASGVTTPTAIPQSGYQVRRTITTGPATKVVLRTLKSPKACTVNGFTTTAGPSAAQSDDVVVRA